MTYRNNINKLGNSDKKQKDLKSYFQDIGLGELYKIYSPQLVGYNKMNSKKYIYNNKNITKRGLPNIYIIKSFISILLQQT